MKRTKNRLNLAVGCRPADYRGRSVRCPNASVLGYGKWKASPGDWLTYEDGTGRSVPARMFASVHDWQGRTDNDPPVLLAVVALAEDLTFGMLRWVNPEHVERVEGRQPPAAMLAWITGAQFEEAAEDPEIMLRMLEYGTVSNDFIHHHDDHMQAWREGVSPATYAALKDDCERRRADVTDD